MNITIKRIKGGYTADLDHLPGSPPTGDGKTKRMAVACLFFRLMCAPEYHRYLTKSPDSSLSINGTPYSSVTGSPRR